MGKKRKSAVKIELQALAAMNYVEDYLDGDEGCTVEEAARSLAEGYAGICILEKRYKSRFYENRHYSRDEAYYLLTQGAHEETERVQTSGPSDGVSRAVANVDSFLARLNREADEEFRQSVIEPYMDLVEKKRMFEFGRDLLDPQYVSIATKLYVDRLPKSEISDSDGIPLPGVVIRKADKAFIEKLSFVLKNYKECCASKGQAIRNRNTAEVILCQMPDAVSQMVREYTKTQED